MASPAANPAASIDEVVKIFKAREVQKVEGSMYLPRRSHSGAVVFFNELGLPLLLSPDGEEHPIGTPKRLMQIGSAQAPCSFESGYTDELDNYDMRFGTTAEFTRFVAKFKKMHLYPSRLTGITSSDPQNPVKFKSAPQANSNYSLMNTNGTYELSP